MKYFFHLAFFINRRSDFLKIKSKQSNKANSGKRMTFVLFTLPGLILYSIFFIAPVIMGVYYSLMDWNGISKKYNYIGFSNYINAFQDSRFIKALLFNAKYSVLLIIFIISLALFISIQLNSKIRCRTFFRATFFLPAVLSMITVGLIFNQLFLKAFPSLGSILGVKWLTTSLLSSKTTAMYAILIVNIWQGLAMPTILLLAGLQSIPIELYESAVIDGATPFRSFKSITIPFLLPVLSVVMVLVLKSGIMIFDYIIALTDGGPGGATESLGILIYRLGMTDMKFSYSIAIAIIVAIIICIISFIQISFTDRKKAL